MKIKLIAAISFFISLNPVHSHAESSDDFADILRDGDIIFHESTSQQSSALRKATGSKYTHTGIIFFYNNIPFVLEAVQPVKKTPLAAFIKRGRNGKFVVKRLENINSFSQTDIMNLKTNSESYIGKKYDILFQWSDSKIYCSELVWKAYFGSLNIKLGKIEKLGDFDLSSREVKQLLKKRNAENLSMDEPIISPISIFNDKRLKTVIER